MNEVISQVISWCGQLAVLKESLVYSFGLSTVLLVSCEETG